MIGQITYRPKHKIEKTAWWKYHLFGSMLVWYVLISMGAMAQGRYPQLVIPAYADTVTSFENKIFFPAYAYQFNRCWPEDLAPYDQVVYGAMQCKVWLRLSGGRLTAMTLDRAITNGDITIYSITTPFLPRQPGLIFEPKLGLELVKIKLAGLILSHEADSGFRPDTAVLHCYGDYDTDAALVMNQEANQACIWQQVYHQQLLDPVKTRELLGEYYTSVIQGNLLPPYYQISLRGDSILINAQKFIRDTANRWKPYYNEDGKPYYMLGNMLADLTDAKISCGLKKETHVLDTLKITGKFKDILPVQFYFTTANPTVFTATLSDSLVRKPGAFYWVKLRLDYELDGAGEACPVRFSSSFDYPLTDPALHIDACGLQIRSKFDRLLIGL